MGLAEEVDARIAKVHQAQGQAIASLQERFWQTEGTRRAAAELRSWDVERIGKWETQGRDAVENGTKPCANGWPGWIEAGNVIIEGMRSLAAEADLALLSNLSQTYDQVVEDVQRVAGKAGKAARDVAIATGEAAGRTAAGVAMPLMPVLVAGVAAIGLWAWGKGRG